MVACTIWTFRTKNFRVVVDCDYQEEAADLSWDDTGEVAEKLDSGEWAVYVMRARLLDRFGDELASDYLGESIYEDPRTFRDHVGSQGKYGSYFTDMVRTVLQEGREEFQRRAKAYREMSELLHA